MFIKSIGIAGRILLAALFIVAGVAKITDPQPFVDHMAAHHIPSVLLPAVIALELGAGLAVLLGRQIPIAAGALGLFCIATAFGFHFDLTNKVERSAFAKDLAIAGSLLLIAAMARRQVTS
jgi:putative oxidoreductase